MAAADRRTGRETLERLIPFAFMAVISLWRAREPNRMSVASRTAAGSIWERIIGMRNRKWAAICAAVALLLKNIRVFSKKSMIKNSATKDAVMNSRYRRNSPSR